jgi:hypothetical protein
MAKIRRMSGYKPEGVQPEDYIYAREVAGQKAVTSSEKEMQKKAQADVKYLEAKYPSIASNFKLFGDRLEQPSHGGLRKKSNIKKAQ